MSSARRLMRLKHIREIEEEQSRLALEAALNELHSLEAEREAGRARQRDGRRLTGSAIREGSIDERFVGLTETTNSHRYLESIQPKIAACASHAAELQDDFLEKRVRLRQAETLTDQAAVLEAAQTAQQTQKQLDDWFGSRRFGNEMTQQKNVELQAQGSSKPAPKMTSAVKEAEPVKRRGDS